MTEDALSAVPRSLREAAYGVGGTKLDLPTDRRPCGSFRVAAAIIVGISELSERP